MSGLTPGIMIKQCRVHEPILTRVSGLLTHPIHTKPIPQEHPVGVLTMPIFELIRYLQILYLYFLPNFCLFQLLNFLYFFEFSNIFQVKKMRQSITNCDFTMNCYWTFTRLRVLPRPNLALRSHGHNSENVIQCQMS